ncbi:MAG: tetratricopeptide repeat protein [Muribaculaceae bacterium]|nr:tetratricopeptide repeat protein [Muribaculaceae bacterium]
MKRYALMSVAAACSIAAAAQINSPTNSGLLLRADAMAAQGNPSGALDCLRELDRAELTTAQAEAADLLAASCLYRSGRYDAARDAFVTFSARYPFSEHREEAFLGIANCYYAQADYATAFDLYRRVEPAGLSDASAAECFYRRGIAAMQCDAPGDARADFEKAARYSSTRPASLFYLGVLDYEAGDYASARERFRSANTATPPGNMADYYLASMDFAEGNWSRALSTARSMLRRSDIEPGMSTELNRIAGESSFKLGERSDALTYLKKYLGAASDPAPTALYIIGVIDFDEGRYADAIYRFMPVTERAEGALRQSAYLYAGQCLLEQGDADAAILAFDKAAKATDDDAVRQAAFYNYAVAKFAGADVPFASAAETFEEFLRLYPTGPYSDRVASYLAAGYIADSDYERALKRINAIANPSPQILRAKQRVLYSLGNAALRSGKLDQAESFLAQAEALNRHDAAVAAEVALSQAELMRAQGRTDEATAKYQLYLRMAAKDAANRPVALYGLAYTLYSAGKASRAEAYFEQALPMMSAPDAKADVLNRLGDIRFASGDFNGAAQRYAQAFKANPSAGDYATLSAARMKGYQRDYRGKLKLLEAFRKDFASSALMPDALLETTQAQISLGNNDDAIATYRTLIADYPRTAQGRQGYLQMAMTLLDMNRQNEAIEAYRSVISMYPSSEEAAQASSLLRKLYTDRGEADEYLSFMAGVKNAPAISEDDAEELSYRSAVKAYSARKDAAQLEAFIRRYPSSKYTSAALAILLDKAAAESNATASAELADRILRDFPDSRAAESALRFKAEAAYASGDLPAALSFWQELEPKASDAATATAARLGVMRTARDMADYTTAGAAADAILSSSAGAEAISEAKFTKGSALLEADKADAAIAIWLELAKNTSDLYGAKAAYEAAAALHESGKSKKALETAQALTRSGSPHRYWVARAFILTADIYSAQGKDFEAREYLEALRENYPGTETDIFMMIDSRLSPSESSSDSSSDKE